MQRQGHDTISAEDLLADRVIFCACGSADSQRHPSRPFYPYCVFFVYCTTVFFQRLAYAALVRISAILWTYKLVAKVRTIKKNVADMQL